MGRGADIASTNVLRKTGINVMASGDADVWAVANERARLSR